MILLDLSIGHRLFLPDGLLQKLMAYVLPLQLHLVVVEDATEGICELFGQLTAFPVE